MVPPNTSRWAHRHTGRTGTSHRLIDWLIGPLIDWLIGPLIDWLIDCTPVLSWSNSSNRLKLLISGPFRRKKPLGKFCTRLEVISMSVWRLMRWSSVNERHWSASISSISSSTKRIASRMKIRRSAWFWSITRPAWALSFQVFDGKNHFSCPKWCGRFGAPTDSSSPAPRSKTISTNCGRCSTFCCRIFSPRPTISTPGSTPTAASVTTTSSNVFMACSAPFCCVASRPTWRSDSRPSRKPKSTSVLAKSNEICIRSCWWRIWTSSTAPKGRKSSCWTFSCR